MRPYGDGTVTLGQMTRAGRILPKRPDAPGKRQDMHPQ